MNPNQIAQNLEHILHRIAQACLQSNRNPEEVRLLMATKTVSAELIKVAIQMGQPLIGENKIQEVKEKYEALLSIPHQSHFIGHLQSNKIKDIIKYEIECVQSIDRFDLAQKLHQRLQAEGKTIDVLLQVNTSNEPSKYGIHPDRAIELVQQVAGLDTLHIKGLMTIGLFSAAPEPVRQCFRLLHNLQQRIIELDIPGVEMKELSMGMSGDLEIAIEEGATIVRVGTAIFGARAHPDSYYWNEGK